MDIQSGRISTRKVCRGAGLVIVASLAAACIDDVARPPVPPATSLFGGVQGTQPFYYYNDSPVYLDVDPSRLVVASPLSSPAGAVVDGLGPSPVQVASVERMPQLHDHWLVRFKAGTKPTAATAARRNAIVSEES